MSNFDIAMKSNEVRTMKELLNMASLGHWPAWKELFLFSLSNRLDYGGNRLRDNKDFKFTEEISLKTENRKKIG